MAEGLQRLFCLGLEGSPPREIATATATTWAESLWEGKAWDRDRDVERFRAAFRSLVRNSGRWPAPRDLLAALPSFEPTMIALPSPQRMQERERSVKAGREVLEKLAKENPWLRGVDSKTQASPE